MCQLEAWIDDRCVVVVVVVDRMKDDYIVIQRPKVNKPHETQITFPLCLSSLLQTDATRDHAWIVCNGLMKGYWLHGKHIMIPY